MDVTEYAAMETPALKKRKNTILVGLAILDKDPRFDRSDPRWQERVDYYNGCVAAIDEELARRPVTIQAKTLQLNLGG